MRQECHLTRCNITEKIAALDLPLGGQELKTEIASIHSHLGGLNSSDFADRVMSGHPCPGPAKPVIGRKQLSIFWGCVGLIWFLQLITVNKCSLTMVLVKSDSELYPSSEYSPLHLGEKWVTHTRSLSTSFPSPRNPCGLGLLLKQRP